MNGNPMVTLDNWNNYGVCIFFTFLRVCISVWDSAVLSFITINNKLVTPYLSFEINLNMASTASECTPFLLCKVFSDLQ